MFKHKTLFILGAGSSAEIGFPLGKELAEKIGLKMDVRFEDGFTPVGDGDFDLYNQVTHQRRVEASRFQRAAWRIRDGIGLAQSIDDFLDQHRTNEYVNKYGKAAIVKSILEAERSSSLYYNPFEDQRFDVSKFSDTWFVRFMHILGRNLPTEEIETIFAKVAFIIFNYDRCVEFFLLNALQVLYGIDEAYAKGCMAGLHIIHPYGTVPDNIPFGSTAVNCSELVSGIKTYTEQAGDASMSEHLIAELDEAEHIVFLGFAYHEQNMRLLAPKKELPSSKQIFGTAYGMSESDVEVVGHQIDAWFMGRNATAYRSRMIRLENKLKCAGLFENYDRSIGG